MKLAIMQPYLFPYVGYFQLIQAVDKFVFYDDVMFIKQGWINRNQILVHGKASLFTVPIQHLSSFKRICDTEVDSRRYAQWKIKFLKCLSQSYGKAPYFDAVSPLVTATLNYEGFSISEMAISSIKAVLSHLGVSRTLIESSSAYSNNGIKATERVLDICQKESAYTYINSSGGKDLYSKEDFARHGIELKFLKPEPAQYRQFNDQFVPCLSIIDVLMFNSPNQVVSLLSQYELE